MLDKYIIKTLNNVNNRLSTTSIFKYIKKNYNNQISFEITTDNVENGCEKLVALKKITKFKKDGKYLYTINPNYDSDNSSSEELSDNTSNTDLNTDTKKSDNHLDEISFNEDNLITIIQLKYMHFQKKKYEIEKLLTDLTYSDEKIDLYYRDKNELEQLKIKLEEIELQLQSIDIKDAIDMMRYMDKLNLTKNKLEEKCDITEPLIAQKKVEILKINKEKLEQKINYWNNFLEMFNDNIDYNLDNDNINIDNLDNFDNTIINTYEN